MAREVILAKLNIDSRGRIFISKEVRSILDFRPGDEIVITKDGGEQDDDSNSLILSLQRSGKVIKTWRLAEELRYG